MFSPGGGGIFNTKGKGERPSLSGMVRWASASIERCLRMGGEGTGVCQSSGRYQEDSPLVRCLEESRALKEEREGKEVGSLAAAGLWVGGHTRHGGRPVAADGDSRHQLVAGRPLV